MNKKRLSACERMGGVIKDGVCMIDGFPTHTKYSEWWGETIIPEALKYGKATVIHASPTDAASLFPPTTFYEETIEELRKRIREKMPINPPWLEVCLNIRDEDGWHHTWVVGHEGRHRIEAARREGLKKVPIIIRHKPEEYCKIEGVE